MKLRGVESGRVIASLKRLLTLRCVIATALMFWCAGTGCMMVSYARATMHDMDASEQSAEQSMAMSSSMDAHACCKAKNKSLTKAHSPKRSVTSDLNEFTLPASAPTDAMSCCPLTSGSIVVGSRSQTNDHASELAQTDSDSLKLANSNQTRVAMPLRLPNRARSYLLDCAFLI
ncbi:MAG TPA: hypothetical protein VNG71_01770 [Pyrinomonadaceae bacterium]|nr:hypothetical protein [Pyrinomonadaceae bacterium]